MVRLRGACRFRWRESRRGIIWQARKGPALKRHQMLNEEIAALFQRTRDYVGR